MSVRYPYKYLILLAAAYFCTFPIIGITFQKPVIILSFQVPVSALIYPITFVLMDIIAEVYGYDIARQLIWCHVILSIYYNFLLFGALSIPSPDGWPLAVAYNQIFSAGVKSTAFFGQLGILIGFMLNAYLITKLKILTRGRYFWVRSVASSSVGEFLQLSIGLIGVAVGDLWSVEYIFKILFFAFLLRMLLIGLLSFPAVVVAAFLKKSENLDIYDVNVNFNPFIFATGK